MHKRLLQAPADPPRETDAPAKLNSPGTPTSHTPYCRSFLVLRTVRLRYGLMGVSPNVTRVRMRQITHRRPALTAGLFVLGALTAAPHSAAANDAAPPSSPCAGNRGIVPTLGSWSPDEDPITSPARFGNRDESFEIRVLGLGTGLGTLADGRQTPPVSFRTVRVRGRTTQLALCRGTRVLARYARPDRRTQIGGVSLNGDRIAWRTWRPGGRGALHVGRVSRKRIVGVRSTAVPALPAKRQINGRILVMPDGTAAWSLPTATGPGVWLWPTGRAPRRLAAPASAGTPTLGWDVRIVDDRHVLLGDTAAVSRYGPTTPGRCPTAVGATTRTFGDRHFVAVQGARYFQSSDSSLWSQLLVCDPLVGDYVHVRASRSSGDKYGNGSGTNPVAILSTAGVAVAVDREAGDRMRVRSEIVRLDDTTVTTAVGAVDGVDPDPALVPTPQGPAVRILPGAVAWLSTPTAAAGFDAPLGVRTVMLADADGIRAVGSIPPAVVDPGLVLTPERVRWTDGTATQELPVRPVPGAIVERFDR